jgi:hypothetical protein
MNGTFGESGEEEASTKDTNRHEGKKTQSLRIRQKALAGGIESSRN